MPESDRIRWNERYEAGEYDWTPNQRLVNLLTGRVRPGSLALDVACGPGRNAIWLAEQGARVDAWDLSDRALALLQTEALRRGLTIAARQVDLEREVPPENHYDLVIDSHFLHRPLLLPLLQALRPGGLLLIDTFLASPKRAAVPAAYKLDPGEFARVYGGSAHMLHLVEDQQDGRVTALLQRPA